MITKESLVDLQEKWEKVKKLIEEDARFDPETQPYFSKYQARQNLIGMNSLLETLKSKEKAGGDVERMQKLVGMHGAVQLQLAIVAIDTEELSIGEKHLNSCEEIVTQYEETQFVASVTLHMYNQLGILWAKREQEKGQTVLEKGDAFYRTIKELGIIPIDYNDLFNVHFEIDEAAAMMKFEKTYTLTLYYLAQVYGPVDSLKSAVFCGKTLRRQLEMQDFDHIDWALNTATLSQFLMEKNGFKQARRFLSASLYMLDEYWKVLEAIEVRNEEYDAKVETYRHRYADVARCWSKYGIILLNNSHDRLMNCPDINVTASFCTDITQMKLEENSTLSEEDLNNWDFPTLDLSEYESQVRDTFVLTMDDAKDVFLNTQKWLQKAQEYYTINTLASDYIEITLDYSRLYDTLVFFEDVPDNRAKLTKRAIDTLEKVISEVNPTYYMQYCRQIWFRLGIFYSDILDIKLDKLKENDNRPSPHALNKINSLVQKSTSHFKNLIESYKNPKGESPGKIADKDGEFAYLRSYFHLAAMETRYITLDKEQVLKNTENSLAAYKKVVDYCKRNEKAGDAINAELSVAKEMVTLLPLKIARIRNELPVPV